MTKAKAIVSGKGNINTADSEISMSESIQMKSKSSQPQLEMPNNTINEAQEAEENQVIMSDDAME